METAKVFWSGRSQAVRLPKQFRVASKVVYRALTTRQTTTVTAAMLTGWKGQGVQLDMVSAKLLNNDIAEGPFQAPLVTINVQ